MSTTSGFAILGLFLVLTLPSGIILLILSLRGRRIDDHPLCRRCGFDLFGLPPDSHRCSECGTDLHHPHALRVGHRQKRKGLLALSLFLLLPGLAFLTAAAYITARNVNLNQYKPVWWLLADADSSLPALRDAALAELTSRLQSNKLSTPHITTIAGRALKLQADLSRPWVRAWGDFVEIAHAANNLPTPTWQQYLIQAPIMRLVVRPKVRRGAPFPYRIIQDARVGAKTTLWINHTYKSVDISGQPTKSNAAGGGGFSLSSGGGGSTGRTLPADDPTLLNLPDGPHTLRLVLDLNIHDSYATYMARKSPPTTTTLTLDTTWELVSAPTVTMTSDPSHRPAIEKALAATIQPERSPRPESFYISVNINCNASPVPLAFDVFLRAAEKDHKVSAVAFQANSSHSWGIGNNIPGVRIGDTVDLILRPSLEAAESQVDMTQYWDGEIILKNILVQPRK